ncbi:hypothetical protein [Actinoplanes rectilineatus]|uniref:hypothetical protein n=1 Tax=Actinoplanes rectilineatus TaxID=113571 RepID=UPI0005F2A2C4|nr:hypothetical protein [Actinoplanes rectilineatus]
MGDQPTSDRKRTPEEATAKPADPRPDETVVLTKQGGAGQPAKTAGPAKAATPPAAPPATADPPAPGKPQTPGKATPPETGGTAVPGAARTTPGRSTMGRATPGTAAPTTPGRSTLGGAPAANPAMPGRSTVGGAPVSNPTAPGRSTRGGAPAPNPTAPGRSTLGGAPAPNPTAPGRSTLGRAAPPATGAAKATPPAGKAPASPAQAPGVPPKNVPPAAPPAKPAPSRAEADETMILRIPAKATPHRPAADDTAPVKQVPPPPAKKPADDTVVIGKLPPVEKTPGKPARKKPAGEDTVIIRLPGKEAPARKRAVGDDTVIIRLPGSKPKNAPRKPRADDTVIIRLPQAPKKKAAGRATVDKRSVGEDTVIIRVPASPKPAPKPVRPSQVDLGYAPWVLALSSLGVVIVALAYGGGRADTGWAMTAYWIGQIIVFSPVVFRLLSRLAGVAESFLLVIGLATNQYLLKWLYSPDQFRFPDELQHWLATTLITESGQLFRLNNALPPAVHFPGLAEMGASISSLTGLPVTAAGVIVAGIAHLIFVGMLFSAVLRASNSPAMAGVSCVTYATAMHYLFFNSMFLYLTAALPFFMMTVWAHRRWRTGGGRKFLALALVGILMTTVSHHVTAFALVATLLLLSVSELVLEKPRQWITLVVPAVALAVVTGWILLVAQDVIAYLEAPVQSLIASLESMFGGSNAEATASQPVPLTQLAVQGAGLLGLLVLFLAVARDMLLRKDRDSWRWAALVGGAVFFAGNGARFLGSGGPEIAGRLSTFTYVPMSIIAAIAIVYAVQIIPPKDENGRRWLSVPPPGVSVTTGRRLAGQVYLGTALITVLMVGARTGGWPPVSALLPGGYLPAAYERSVDAYGVEAALWQAANLSHDSRVGGDITAVALSSTYGRTDPVREVGELFYATTWGGTEQEIARSRGVGYLVVDDRLGDALPSNDAYFQGDPMAGRITEPLSELQLHKFDTITSVSRIYDNGKVRIYQLGAS